MIRLDEIAIRNGAHVPPEDQRTTRSVVHDLRRNGLAIREMRRNPEALRAYQERRKTLGWEPIYLEMVEQEHRFAEQWIARGSIVFELTHELAAMFAMTSAPPLEWSHAPHEFFVVKVPRCFLPVEGAVASDDTWILAGPGGALIVPDYDTTAVAFATFDSTAEHRSIDESIAKSASHTFIGDLTDDEKANVKHASSLALRHVANLIAYVNEHRDRVQPKGKWTTIGRGTFTVRPPVDVVVDRAFRQAAIEAVASRNLLGVRRAMAHVVRGHWRNQAVGEGRAQRRVTWVRPHKRGSESLGAVVSRIERLAK